MREASSCFSKSVGEFSLSFSDPYKFFLSICMRD
jgi:hypothetical protein